MCSLSHWLAPMCEQHRRGGDSIRKGESVDDQRHGSSQHRFCSSTSPESWNLLSQKMMVIFGPVFEICTFDILSRNMPTARKRIVLSFLTRECNSEVLIFFIEMKWPLQFQTNPFCANFRRCGASSRQSRDHRGVHCALIGRSRPECLPRARWSKLLCVYRSVCEDFSSEFARCQLLFSSIVYNYSMPRISNKLYTKVVAILRLIIIVLIYIM